MGKVTFRRHKPGDEIPQPTSPVVTKRDGTKVICLTVTDRQSQNEAARDAWLRSIIWDIDPLKRQRNGATKPI